MDFRRKKRCQFKKDRVGIRSPPMKTTTVSGLNRETMDYPRDKSILATLSKQSAQRLENQLSQPYAIPEFDFNEDSPLPIGGINLPTGMGNTAPSSPFLPIATNAISQLTHGGNIKQVLPNAASQALSTIANDPSALHNPFSGINANSLSGSLGNILSSTGRTGALQNAPAGGGLGNLFSSGGGGANPLGNLATSALSGKLGNLGNVGSVAGNLLSGGAPSLLGSNAGGVEDFFGSLLKSQ